MPDAFDATGDFTVIVDAVEAVTLLRRGSPVQVNVATAWRYTDRRSETEHSGGYAVQADVEWQFEWDATTKLPQLGDRIRDGAGECYTVLAVNRLQAATRLRLETRSLRIAHGLDCLVDIEQAVWEDLGSGPEVTGWTTFRPAVHARIQPLETTVDETTNPITSTATYRVLLDDDAPLDHHHRIVAGNGTVYRLLNYTGAERIDALPVATVRRE